MQDKFSLMPEGKDPLKDLRTTLKMQEAVTKKREQKGSGDPYLDLQRDQFELMKQEKAEAKEAAQQSAMTQGVMGGLQSGVQTAFGSQSQEQAISMFKSCMHLATLAHFVSSVWSHFHSFISCCRSCSEAHAHLSNVWSNSHCEICLATSSCLMLR